MSAAMRRLGSLGNYYRHDLLVTCANEPRPGSTRMGSDVTLESEQAANFIGPKYTSEVENVGGEVISL